MNACPQRVLFHQHPEHHPAHALAVAGDEQIVGLLAFQNIGPPVLDVAHDGLACELAKGHQPLLVALAHHPQHAFVQAQVKGLQADQLTDTQAAGIHQLQHGAVALAQRCVCSGRGQQRFNLGLAHHLGHTQGLPG